jgi:hypothetical protein
MTMEWACFGDLSIAVLLSLDVQDLAYMEMAGKAVDKKLTLYCWQALVSTEERKWVWRPWLYQKLPQETHGKLKLKDIVQLRRYFEVIPKVWSPQIMLVSPSSLQLRPLDDESWFFGELAPPETAPLDDSRAALAKPSVAIIPLAWGAKPGETMAIGFHIESSSACASDGVLLGLEFHGMPSWGPMSVHCSPFTGQCKVKFPRKDGEITAQAFHPLACDYWDSVDMYVTISELGDIEFIRYCKATDCLVRSGRICIQMPAWVTCVFTSVAIRTEHIYSETLVSTKWSASALPRDLQSQLEYRSLADFVFDAEWSYE